MQNDNVLRAKFASNMDTLARLPELQRRRFLKGLMAASALGSTALLQACGGGSSGSPATSGNSSTAGTSSGATFTMAFLPDTQFYPRYACNKMGGLYQKRYPDISAQYDNPFKTQTQWIAQNAKQLKLAFTAHLGDIVDQPYYYGKEGSTPWSASTDLVSGTQLSDGSVSKEWELASQAMQVLEKAGVPYSILAGNHDMGSIGSDIQWGPDWGVGVGGFNNNDGFQDGGNHRNGSEYQPYLNVFPKERAAQQTTFKERDSSGFHEYHIFHAEGQDWLVLAMSWRASDAAIAWADWVIKANPTLPVILTSHQFAGVGKDGVSAADTAYSNYLWDRLIKNNDQVFMVVSGHYHGSCYSKKTNAAGNDVHVMVVDYQMSYMGGNGLMRLYEFDLANKRIAASSFSPWVIQKPSKDLNEFDAAWLPEASHNFSIDIDFTKRFAGFAPKFAVQAGTPVTSLTDQAKALILTNFKEPHAAPGVPAKDANDYPVVAETAAHWRFYNAAAASGTALTSGYKVNDISGNANHVGLATWAGNASDVTWTTDHHPLSATPGSVQFSNSTNTHFNYFVTDSGMPINTATFDQGYTMEAFVYIDPSWNAAQNAWMGILYRLGKRAAASGITWAGGVDTDDTMMMMAISNLMEVQWEVVPAHGSNNNENFACWSGGITAGQWLHIAVVNDPNDGFSTTMYVEGAPILRNNSGMNGIGCAGEKLLSIGTAQYGGSMGNGFIGKISEIRIVSKPLPSNQWLTARKSS